MINFHSPPIHFWLFLFLPLFSVFVTWLIRVYALRNSILDIPNERSSHLVPTPRGGGIAIVLTFLLGLCWLLWNNLVTLNSALALSGGTILISAVGYWDDVSQLKARYRAAAHLAAACWALYWLGGFPVLEIGVWNIPLGWFGNILAIFGIVWFINLYNFMDGIDGLAGMEGMFASIAGGLILWLTGAQDFALLAFVLAMSVSGFLVWNWPKAKIFMGDVGSGTLGYIFAVLLIGSANETKISPVVWIILLAVFVFDASFTLIRRLWRREVIYLAHCSHAYQRAVRRGSSHLSVILQILCINIFLLGPLAYLTVILPLLMPGILFILLLSGWLLWRRTTR